VIEENFMAPEDRIGRESSERTLTITRTFDAPRSLVFKAWTEREHRMRWWGPRGFTVTFCEMDLRPGGGWRLAMRSPEGREDRQRGIFREIVPPERLVFTYAFEDANGNLGHETLVTVTFAEHEGKTKLTVNHAVFETVAVRDDHVRGWGEALDRLAQYATTL
jgi:uncharacterized protein YndB with AHSA1/START domain